MLPVECAVESRLRHPRLTLTRPHLIISLQSGRPSLPNCPNWITSRPPGSLNDSRLHDCIHLVSRPSLAVSLPDALSACGCAAAVSSSSYPLQPSGANIKEPSTHDSISTAFTWESPPDNPAFPLFIKYRRLGAPRSGSPSCKS